MKREEQIEAGAQALWDAYPTLREDFHLGVVPRSRQDRAGGREVIEQIYATDVMPGDLVNDWPSAVSTVMFTPNGTVMISTDDGTVHDLAVATRVTVHRESR